MFTGEAAPFDLRKDIDAWFTLRGKQFLSGKDTNRWSNIEGQRAVDTEEENDRENLQRYSGLEGRRFENAFIPYVEERFERVNNYVSKFFAITQSGVPGAGTRCKVPAAASVDEQGEDEEDQDDAEEAEEQETSSNGGTAPAIANGEEEEQEHDAEHVVVAHSLRKRQQSELHEVDSAQPSAP